MNVATALLVNFAPTATPAKSSTEPYRGKPVIKIRGASALAQIVKASRMGSGEHRKKTAACCENMPHNTLSINNSQFSLSLYCCMKQVRPGWHGHEPVDGEALLVLCHFHKEFRIFR